MFAQFLNKKIGDRRWLWFIVIYCVSTITVIAAISFLKWIIFS